MVITNSITNQIAKMYPRSALLNIAISFSSIIFALAVSAENDASQSTIYPPNAAQIIKEPGESIDGATFEDLVLLQCLCQSSLDDPATDLISDELLTAYSHYAVQERNIQQGLDDYIDLSNMQVDQTVSKYGSLMGATDQDMLPYALRKARRDITAMIEKANSYRISLVRLTSEAAVEALDDKHGWSFVDDKQVLESPPKSSQHAEHPHSEEPTFKDTRSKLPNY